MIGAKRHGLSQPREHASQIGTPGHLAIFVSMVAAVLVAGPASMPVAAGLCLGLAVLLYPAAFRRLLKLRWLLFLLVLALPQVLLPGEGGLAAAAAAALRALVVLVAINGLARSVNIVEVAGLLERVGLTGLGFAMGVAVNLLPALLDSARSGWYSLKMRGGLRRQSWRALQLLFLTMVTNAIRRAEDIALAAEARAYTPERSRVQPLRRGRLDWGVAAAGLAFVLGFALLG
ncbi:MAG: hypothetical protein GX484_08540 [Chloroflexi bacterium]|nr:hypothetical protein [Chloroflexota bacterium]